MMDVLTSEPGMQFFTANHLDGSLSRGEVVFGKHAGLCFETQHFPDSPNHAGFPSTLLLPDSVFTSTTVYKFSSISP
jgi:aldose 1-epimerase